MKEPTAVSDPSGLPIPTRDLRSLVVRPIYASERERWDSLMREHHYLGFGWFAGKSIKHVVLLDGEWVALLGWATSYLLTSLRGMVEYERDDFSESSFPA